LRHLAIRTIVEARRDFRRSRCSLFERFGSARYSRTALDDIDRQLEHYLSGGGVFVEAGANDGYRKSNTYYLERFRGWTGVLIEPIPALAAQCRRRRPRSRVFQCALVAPDHPTANIAMTHADMLSEVVVDGRPPPQNVPEWLDVYEVTVPARTLSDVLSDAGVRDIDFLSLDLQGHEAAALRGLDFERWSPTIMLIEIDDHDARRAVDSVLGMRYDPIAQLSVHDILYRRR